MKKNRKLENRIFLNATPDIFQKAHELRNNQTEAEKIMWEKLKNRKFEGLKFRRQHPINKFVADFYCAEKNLVIEIDGGYHTQDNQKERDEGRTSELERYGIKVIRFTNTEIINQIEKVLLKLKPHIS